VGWEKRKGPLLPAHDPLLWGESRRVGGGGGGGGSGGRAGAVG